MQNLLKTPMRLTTAMPLILLLITGLFLTANVIISRQVAAHNLPSFWFLSLIMGAGGILLFFISKHKAHPFGPRKEVLTYGAISGALMAIGSILPYLTVTHVGISYLSILYTISPMITYIISLAVGVDRLLMGKIIAVNLGLLGSLWIALAKFQGLGHGGLLWLVLASLMPVFLAIGNVYRTKYWPKGAHPMALAAVMLLFAGGELALFSLFYEPTRFLELFSLPSTLFLIALGVLSSTIYFIFFFILQKLAGPVYLGQIGSVAAVIGTLVGFFGFGELLPNGFLMASLLIAMGIFLFQREHSKSNNP